jgi:hypothetical protein
LAIVNPIPIRRAVLAMMAAATSAYADAADDAPRSHEPPQLVAMAPIVVPIVGSDRLEGALRLKLVLEATDAAGLARLTERLPALRAVSLAGAIEFSRLYASPRTPVNAVVLRAALTAALHA